ncbi:type VII secretion-associated serine protease mycosin [Corynebacterium sp. A21]|uniref:type VII secretion-associated serine protease mycosin n=1 Tax=Corynebacterium sp. A21 TaxID=3457318 RepID=UPI003FCFD315
MLSTLFIPIPGFAQEAPQCAVPVPYSTSPPESGLELAPAHALATGAGVKVAVIDTGVAPHPRLGEVIDGGDFLGTPDPPESDPAETPTGALVDCDGHGTVVAGVIATRPTAEDDLVGVAPEAEIISIRQSSARYRTTDDSPLGTVGTLAGAIHRAVDHQAQVISISVVACVPADTAAHLNTDTLDEALARAEEAGAIVVAAAGNLGPNCEPDSVVYPAHSATVLAVSGYRDPHLIADYSVPVPAQPLLSAHGLVPVALSPDGAGLASGLQSEQGVVPFEGTSFAAPVVAGTAALLRQRYPYLSATEIRQRILDSVDPASGALDPHRALSQLPPGNPPEPREIQVRVLSQSPQVAPRRAAGLLVGLGVAVVLAATVLGWQRPNIRRTRLN